MAQVRIQVLADAQHRGDVMSSPVLIPFAATIIGVAIARKNWQAGLGKEVVRGYIDVSADGAAWTEIGGFGSTSKVCYLKSGGVATETTCLFRIPRDLAGKANWLARARLSFAANCEGAVSILFDDTPVIPNPPGHSSVTYDNDGEASGTAVSSLTISSFVLGNNANRYLLVGAAGWDGTAGDTAISSVSWGGVTTGWNVVGDKTYLSTDFARMRGKIAPTAATANLIVTMVGAISEFMIACLSAYNVDQTTPVGTAATGSGTADTATVTVGSVNATDLVADIAYIYVGSGTLTVGASQTQRAKLNITGSAWGAASTQLGSAGGVMSWSSTTLDEWCNCAVAIKEVSGPTIFYQNVGQGSLTSASTLNRLTAKAIGSGAVALASTLNRKTCLSPGAGAVSLAGALTSILKHFASVGGGEVTSASTLGILVAKNVGAGAVGLAGAVGRLIAIGVGSGAVGISGAVASILKHFKDVGSGALASSGSLALLIAKAVGLGSVSMSGALSSVLKIFMAVGSGSLTSAGTLGRSILISVGAGAVTSAGTLALKTLLGVGSGAVGIASTLGLLISREVGSGAVALSSTVGRVVSKAVGAGAVAISATVNRLIAIGVGAGAVSSSGMLTSILKIFQSVGNGAVGLSGALSSILSGGVLYLQAVGNGAVAMAGTLGRAISLTVGQGSVSLSSVLSRLIAKAVGQGAVTLSGALIYGKIARRLTLYVRSLAMTLRQRRGDRKWLFPYTFPFYFADTLPHELTLNARSTSLTLHSRSVALTLFARSISLSLPSRGV